MFKVVLDTSTLVSAFFWEGNEAELLRKIEQRKARLFITKEILDEVEEVIKRPKFKQVMDVAGLSPEQIVQKLVAISTLVVGPGMNTKVCRDEKDDKFLECAQNVKADYIVSGDEDLLALKRLGKISIIRTSKMLELIK